MGLPETKTARFPEENRAVSKPVNQERCLWAAKNVRQCEKSGKACECAQRDAPAGFLSGFFHDYSSYSLSGGSSRPGPWRKHLLKSGAEGKCKKRLNEGVFDGLPFAPCIGMLKKQSVSATLKPVPFLASPQFRLKCNRFKGFIQTPVENGGRGHVAVAILPLKPILNGCDRCFIDHGQTATMRVPHADILFPRP